MRKFSTRDPKKEAVRKEEMERLRASMKELLDHLDQKHIAHMFKYGMEIGMFIGRTDMHRLHIAYTHGDFQYILTREPSDKLIAKTQKSLLLEKVNQMKVNKNNLNIHSRF